MAVSGVLAGLAGLDAELCGGMRASYSVADFVQREFRYRRDDSVMIKRHGHWARFHWWPK
jgi:hypothetical protein